MGKVIPVTAAPTLGNLSKHLRHPTCSLNLGSVSAGGRELSFKTVDGMETNSSSSNQGSLSGQILSTSATNTDNGNASAGSSSTVRVPLGEVVSDCVKRWFKDTLREAKTGDINMQVLVGQMYYSGYGVTRDAQKGRIWLTRASKTRSTVWKVGDKHPGYNASDSDSDEIKVDS